MPLPLLPPRANPTRVPTDERSARAVQRLVFCASYHQCLDVAVRGGWEDWTCSRCPLTSQATAPSAASLATRQPRDRD